LNRALVYCADTEQLEAVHRVLNTHRIMHTRYVAETPVRARRAALQAIEKGHVPCLLAIDCLDEGVDVPVVDMAVILASSTNKRQFVQRRGRILRRALGKKRATLIDVIVVPPASVGIEGRALLNSELARAKEMAETATNRYDTLLQVKEYTARYGVLLTELLSGEGNG
jgi:superfamily II DNA or RNA helicase